MLLPRLPSLPSHDKRTRHSERHPEFPEGADMPPNPSKGGVSAVRRAECHDQIRVLLDEHIRAVSALIHRLNKDIQGVQQQMRAQDEVTHRTQTSVRKMEVQQLAVLSDLRARVGRCDDSIARLAADYRSTNERIYKLIRQHHGAQTLMESKLRDLETQVRLQCSKAVQGRALDQTSTSSSSTLDTKLAALSEQLRAQVAAGQSAVWEQECVLRDAVDKMERLCQSISNKTSSDERAAVERCVQLSDRLTRLEQSQRGRALPHPDCSLEELIDSRISKLQKQLWRELQEIKAETNNGFAIVHDSLGSLRKILEAKMKMERDRILKRLRGPGRSSEGRLSHHFIQASSGEDGDPHSDHSPPDVSERAFSAE
ncbi:protein FAM81A-like [Sardina pilchardus]|uniref:protein FAM81A-like n=1 Tax=Sardina pilchardus TaxID=27697 RepID=UPI002E0F1C9A